MKKYFTIVGQIKKTTKVLPSGSTATSYLWLPREDFFRVATDGFSQDLHFWYASKEKDQLIVFQKPVQF